MNKKSFALILKFIAMIFAAQISSECFLECIWIRKTEGLPISELKKKNFCCDHTKFAGLLVVFCQPAVNAKKRLSIINRFRNELCAMIMSGEICNANALAAKKSLTIRWM